MPTNLVNFANKIFQFSKTTWQDVLQSMCSKLHIPSFAYVVKALIFRLPLCSEMGVIRFLGSTTGELFVDVGAGYGRYCVFLGKKFKRMVAIEPVPRNMRTIRNTLHYAHLGSTQFLQCAVSDKNGGGILLLKTCACMHTLRNSTKTDIVGRMQVNTRTLESILNGRMADLVKVDVEGSEWWVLKGAERVVPNIRRWVVELHNLQEKRKIERWFGNHGYFIKWINSHHVYAWRP